MNERQRLALAPHLPPPWMPPRDTYAVVSGPWCSEILVEDNEDLDGLRWRASLSFVVMRPTTAEAPFGPWVPQTYPVAHWTPDMKIEALDILDTLLEGVGGEPVERLRDTNAYHEVRPLTDRELELARIPLA